MIALKNIAKSYGAQIVLNGFSLEIADGARVAVMGRSGAGKTTLLRLILGLEKPNEGTVEVPKSVRFGTVFQEDRLIEPLTAAANCRLVMKKNADIKAVLSLLDSLGITENLAQKPVSELSGGEKRRVAIARALLSEPDVLVLDEPFKGIDSETLPKVIERINAAAEGKTVILVTHSAEEAEMLRCKITDI